MREDDQSVTIERGAEILGVSREFLCKLIDDGVIPEHRMGAARHVYLRDVFTYRECRDKERGAALKRISRAAAKLGLYERNKFPEGGQDE
jgi:excisionase family DNA binding protein